MKHHTFPFHYQLHKGIYTIDGVSHVGYGIEIIKGSDHSIHMRIEDISVSKQDIANLIERCNRLQLDPEQLFDVVQDHLTYVEI